MTFNLGFIPFFYFGSNFSRDTLLSSSFLATIRFLDPPLHEFLPHKDDEIAELSKTMGLAFEELKSTVESLHEFNPMVDLRILW